MCIGLCFYFSLTLPLKIAARKLKFQAMVLPLFRSPIRTLIKCTSVCKTWRTIVENPSVIRPHLSQTVHVNNLNDSRLFLIRRAAGTDGNTIFHKAIVHNLIEAFNEYCKIEFPSAPKEKLHNPHLRVVGTCNGLVCLADDICRYGYNFYIWNPAIRKLMTLPKPGATYSTHGGYDAAIGFSFDANTNDYKVVRLVTRLDFDEDECTIPAEVCSLATPTGSWTSLCSIAPSSRIRGGQ